LNPSRLRCRRALYSKELFEFGTSTSTTYNFLPQIAGLIKTIYREMYIRFATPKFSFLFFNFILDYRQKDKEKTETDKETQEDT
jgi:hypothetical protein